MKPSRCLACLLHQTALSLLLFLYSFAADSCGAHDVRYVTRVRSFFGLGRNEENRGENASIQHFAFGERGLRGKVFAAFLLFFFFCSVFDPVSACSFQARERTNESASSSPSKQHKPSTTNNSRSAQALGAGSRGRRLVVVVGNGAVGICRCCRSFDLGGLFLCVRQALELRHPSDGDHGGRSSGELLSFRRAAAASEQRRARAAAAQQRLRHFLLSLSLRGRDSGIWRFGVWRQRARNDRLRLLE